MLGLTAHPCPVTAWLHCLEHGPGTRYVHTANAVEVEGSLRERAGLPDEGLAHGLDRRAAPVACEAKSVIVLGVRRIEGG